MRPKQHAIKLDPKNALRMWDRFRKCLEGSFSGHSDRNRTLREKSQWDMKHGKVDRFVDEPIRLATLLVYSGEFVKDRARMGMTDFLNATWSMKTPHPLAYMDYLDLLRQTGHQLEDVTNFRIHLQKAPHTWKHTKTDDRYTSERKGQSKEKKATGLRQQQPRNQAPEFGRPAETEHAKMYCNVPHTLIDKRKRLNQCSRCAQDGHCWTNCLSAASLIAS